MSVNKVQLANGETIIDISDSTVTPETLAEGVTAHDASGQKITGKMAPGGGSSVQSDWNQTDSSAADFIKNKPFGDELVELMPETVVAGEDLGDGTFGTALAFPLDHIAETLVFVFDGVEYVCDNNAAYAAEMGLPALYGNLVFIGAEDTGEPFIFAPMEMLLVDGEPHTLSISELVSINVPEKYLSPKKLYCVPSGDKYLYTDVTFTNKATIVDVPDSADFVVGVSNGVAVSRWCNVRTVYSRLAAHATGYNMLSIDLDGESRKLYTAEYTPET